MADDQSRRSRRRLTAAGVTNAKPDPSGKRLEIPDAGQPGLYLIVQPNGRRSWALRYRRLSDRKPCKLTLDGFPDLATARRLARAALDKIGEGGDPAAEKRAAKHNIRGPEAEAIADAFRLFLDKYTRTKGGRPLRETTRRETGRLLGFKRDPAGPGQWTESGGGVLANWKGKTAGAIRPADVRDLLEELVDAGHGVKANRTLAALKTCFSWLHRRDPDALPRSPCDGIDDPAPETPRERVLTDAELAALWKVATSESYPFGHMVQLLVLTGCRRDEVRDAPWSEIDMKAREWSIPAKRTKNGREHLVPIVDQAAAILEKMPRISGSRLLFTTTGETSISGLARYKARLEQGVAKELGAEPERWTLHDLRRTLATGLQRLGFPVEVCEAVLNHTGGVVSGVAAVYAKHDYLNEKRAALEAWARHIDSIVGGEGGNVVPMRATARR
jgi:integrase